MSALRVICVPALLALAFAASGDGRTGADTQQSSANGAPGRSVAFRQPGPARIEPPVAAAVEGGGRATVHVVLRGSRALPPSASPHGESLFRAEVASAQRAFRESLPARGIRILRAHANAFGAVAEIDATGLASLRRNPHVERVYLDGEVQAFLAQGVPLIDADVMHGLGHTGSGMAIAILDTGIDYTHAALGGCFGGGCKVVAGYDFYNNDADPMDDGGHGTGVAGIAAANGGGLLGTAPGANLAALKVLAGNGVGTFAAVDAALDWVLTNRVAFNIKVANLSLGDSGQYDDPDEPLCSTSTTANLIRSLVNVGVAVTVATGNNGYDFGISFPSCVAEATAVAAVYDADHGSVTWCADKACTAILCIDSTTGADVFICRNNAGSLLDLIAPSWKATTAQMGGGTRDLGGTSSAAPYAAGAFALMFQALPGASVASVEGNLAAHGVPVLHPASGLYYPRIDIDDALSGFDPDVDQIPTASDNCPATYNPSQSDGDSDTVGDACDNCPMAANTTQINGDGDPAGAACDCNDAQAAVYPGAMEVCDGFNNDCAHPAWPSLVVETDDDSDTVPECAGDCDDGDPTRRPGLAESCDGVDNNCDGLIPGESDADGDGYRPCSGDCDDSLGTVKPGAPEICDGRDNDCNFQIPPAEADLDRDGSFVCSGDCDDTRSIVRPGAPEICDGLDDNCDTVIPPGEADVDSDGVFVCGGDCDDDAHSVHPGAPEVCDGFNNDCNHPSWPSLSVETDDDLDGLAECAGDCDDTAASVRPGRADRCNDVDDNCDGRVDPNYPYITEAPLLSSVPDPNGSEFDRVGASVAPTGDLTGDSIPDILVGAAAWPAGLQNRGSVLLVSGATRAVVRRMTHPTGSSAAQLGLSVAAAGDVDGDGKNEIVSGAPHHSGGPASQGRVVLFSGATGSVVWTYDDPSLPANALLGAALARIGDLNADGVAEILAGAAGDCAGGFGCSGSVWILDGISGQQLGFVSDPSDEPQEKFGTSVAAVGDLTGDGKEDFAVGAPNRDTGGFFNAGAVLTFSGATGAPLDTLSDSSPGPRDQFGSALAVADVNGDGDLDLIAGAPGHMTGAGLDVGQVVVLSGTDNSVVYRLSDPNGAAGDRFGASVAVLGDIDRDGLPEILVGAAFRNEPGAPDAGSAFIFSGRTGARLLRLTHPAPAESDQFGGALAGLPPLDGDGVPEIAAGVPLDDDAAGEDAGTLLVFSPRVWGDCDGDGIRNTLDPCTDRDLDSYGSTLFFPPACSADCDDERATVHPGAPEICDGLDSDCDASIPPTEADGDGDGVVLCAGDCNDAEPAVYPGAPQVCDGLNNNCSDPAWPAVSPNECFNVDNLRATDVLGYVQLDWDVPPGGATRYRIYGGVSSDLPAGHNGGYCVTTSTTNSVIFPDDPGPGGISFYLVAGMRGTLEGSRGRDSDNVEREHSNVCP